MKSEHLTWFALYLGLAGFFFLSFFAPPDIADQARFALVGITWCRIASFIYIGFVMDGSWYQPRTRIFNAFRVLSELAILIGLWHLAQPTQVVVSILALVLYELARQRVKYPTA